MGRRKKEEPKYAERVESLAHRYNMWLTELFDKYPESYAELKSISDGIQELSVKEYQDWNSALNEFKFHDEIAYWDNKKKNT